MFCHVANEWSFRVAGELYIMIYSRASTLIFGVENRTGMYSLKYNPDCIYGKNTKSLHVSRTLYGTSVRRGACLAVGGDVTPCM
jgi:hypothetical protein